jgi:hypothetical protein
MRDDPDPIARTGVASLSTLAADFGKSDPRGACRREPRRAVSASQTRNDRATWMAFFLSPSKCLGRGSSDLPLGPAPAELPQHRQPVQVVREPLSCEVRVVSEIS